MLKESTKLKSLTGPIDAFVAHYMPFMDGKDTLVNAVTQKLMKGNDRCLDEDGWISIRKRPGLNEDETFAEMANIAEAIYQKAVEHDPALMDHRTTILECRPRQGMAAEVSGGSGLPDAMATTTKPSVPTPPPEPNDGRRRSPRLQAKAKAIFYGDVNKQTRNASDAGLVGEFKLLCTPSSIEDVSISSFLMLLLFTLSQNEGKILLGSGFILFNDPCRRFTFGFTIEDSSLRLWFFSRGHIAVSERVDFHEVFRLFASVISHSHYLCRAPSILFVSSCSSRLHLPRRLATMRPSSAWSRPTTKERWKLPIVIKSAKSGMKLSGNPSTKTDAWISSHMPLVCGK